MNTTVHLAKLLTVLFGQFETSKVQYLVLRNYQELPNATTNDIDMLIDPDQLVAAVKCLKDAASTTGWRIHNVGEFSCWTFYLYHLESFVQVHIDFMCGLKWYSVLFADHKDMLKARRRYKCFYIPAQEHEAMINLTTRLLYHGYVRKKYRSGIADAARSIPERFHRVLSPWIGRRLASEFLLAAQNENWDQIEKSRNSARVRVLIANLRKPCSFLLRIVSDFCRLIRRLRESPGFSLAIHGFDASKASCVSVEAVKTFPESFSPERTRHLRWCDDLTEKDEARKSCVIRSNVLMRPLLILADVLQRVVVYNVKWFRKVKPLLFRNGLVVLDGYGDEFVVRLACNQHRLCRGVHRLGLRLIPRPDLFVVLVTSSSGNAESAKQRAMQSFFVWPFRDARVVESNQSVEKTISAIKEMVFSYLVERAASRMKGFK